MEETEIPEDVENHAFKLATDWLRLDEETLKHSPLTSVIARAIMAERERCAKVAERDADWTAFSRQSRKDFRGDETNVFAAPADETLPTPANVFAYTNGIATGRAIAASIRSGV